MELIPLTEGQTKGAVALVVIMTLIYSGTYLKSVFDLFFPSPPPFVLVPFSQKEAGMQAVGLAIDENEKGVFFLPRGATVSDLLVASGFDVSCKLNGGIGARKLSAGEKVFFTSGYYPSLVVGKMKAAQMLALDLPLDVNHSGFDELLLIPGIGIRTAAKIIYLRERKGRFHSMEELTEIKGIKGKKLNRFRKYLCAGGF